MPDRLEASNYYRGHDSEHIFLPHIASEIDVENPLQITREVYHRTQSSSMLQRMLNLDLQCTLGDDDLRKVSRMCELAGVSVAFPLLDSRVVAFSTGLPPKIAIRNLELRYFFKYAFRDFLPRSTLEKSKHGFGLPFGHWMGNFAPLRDLANDSLNALGDRNIFQPDFLKKILLSGNDRHSSYYGELVWVLMMLELWLQRKNPCTGI
jgi:asparagine synthase (glutamine-hydrolysing)